MCIFLFIIIIGLLSCGGGVDVCVGGCKRCVCVWFFVVAAVAVAVAWLVGVSVLVCVCECVDCLNNNSNNRIDACKHNI